MNSTNNAKIEGRSVFITSAYEDSEPIGSFVQLAAADSIKKYHTVTDPEAADVILFVENSHYHSDSFFSQLRSHPLVKKYPRKVFMYNPHDRPWLVLPGVYPCMSSHYLKEDFVAASPYVEVINPYIECDFSVEPKYLFSFYGAISSVPRRKLAHIKHPRAKIEISKVGMYGAVKSKDLQMQYVDLMKDSKFVLCPRGSGSSSIRLFETMKAGRVPVIIADDWVAPAGPNWADFAVFIAEKDVSKIPQLLEQAEKNWEKAATLSRQAWETYFAPEVIFSYLVDRIFALKKTYADLDSGVIAVNYIPYLQFAFRIHVINSVKKVINKIVKL